MQARLMGALLTPLIGFNPADVDLFEIPMVKDRMTAILGDNYEPTMKLLNTAQSIQKEGALFYVVSRYAPSEVREITDQAAMIWNADTNQMAVMLIQDGMPQVFSEQIANAKEALIPTLPVEVQARLDQALEFKKAHEEKVQALLNIEETIEKEMQKTVEASVSAASESAKAAIIEQVGNQALVNDIQAGVAAAESAKATAKAVKKDVKAEKKALETAPDNIKNTAKAISN
ncbi:hypothetical protein R50072_11840 [Simiduia litorea]